MKIDAIKIVNFGILQDVEFDFTNGNQSLVFVNGRNGRGKTSFLAALKWCFFGHEPIWGTAVNKETASATKNGGVVEVKVEISLTMDEGQGSAKIEKTQAFNIVDGKISNQIGQGNFVVKSKGDSDNAYVNVAVDPGAWVEKNFPRRLENFFLFDGELMANFFDSKVQKYISDAVREIAGVDRFESLRDSLHSVRESLDKKIAKAGGEKAQKAQEKYRDETKLLVDIHRDLEAAEQDVKEFSILLEEVIAKRKGVEISPQDASRALELNALISELEGDLKEKKHAFESKVLATGTLALLEPMFGAINEEYDRAIRAGIDVPPKFDPSHLEELIEDGECICGCALTKGSTAVGQIRDLISRSETASEIGNILKGSNFEIAKLASQWTLLWDLVEGENKAVIQIERDLTKHRLEQQALANLGNDSSFVSSVHLGAEQERLQAAMSERHRKIGNLEREQTIQEGRVARAEQEFEKASKGLVGVEAFRRQSKVARILADAADGIHGLALESVRKKLEDTIDEKFTFVSNGQLKTQVTDDFRVLTTYEDGSDAQLSQGQLMMKSYIFAIAIRQVMSLSLPLIVDTPLGRIDQANTEELAKYLAQLAMDSSKVKSRQILFLMHDGEYTPYTRKYFAEANPLELYLEYKPNHELKVSSLGLGISPEWFEHTAWKDWKEGKI